MNLISTERRYYRHSIYIARYDQKYLINKVVS